MRDLPIGVRVGGGLVLIFTVLVSLQIHGFSLARWHSIIDGSESTEVLLGTPRYIRVDDWLVQLPLAYAQAAHDPAFPVHNEKIGVGQSMLLPIVTPVAHPVAIFRPTQWGFFLGNDVGTAWLWWSQVLGLAGVWFGVFWTLTRGRAALATAGAVLLVVSPFFQLWSFTKSTIPIYLGLAWLATIQLATARSRRMILVWSILLGWAGTAFAVVLYPPFQIPLLYLYLALLAGWTWEHWREAPWREHLVLRSAGLVGAGVFAVMMLALFYLDAREAIEAMRGTAYPGDRISTGGEMASWRLLTAHFGSSWNEAGWGALDNIVEASSFLICFPVIGVALLWSRSRDPIAWLLFAYCVAIAAYREFGIPELLSRASLFSFAPGKRALIGLGIADALLVLRFLSGAGGGRVMPGRLAAAVGLVWAALLGVGGLELQEHLPALGTSWMVVAALLNGVLAFALVRRWRPPVLVGSMAAAIAVTTLWFNPLARAGSDYLVENPLSQEILRLDRAHDGETTWLAFGNSDLPNLFRPLGLRSIGGANVLPQLALWRAFDPAGASVDVYNRYAHVGFRPSLRRGVRPAFRLSSHQGFIVYLDPEGSDLERIGVTHLLVRPRKRSREFWAGFEPAGQHGRHLLFELPLRRRVEDRQDASPSVPE